MDNVDKRDAMQAFKKKFRTPRECQRKWVDHAAGARTNPRSNRIRLIAVAIHSLVSHLTSTLLANENVIVRDRAQRRKLPPLFVYYHADNMIPP